MHDGRVVRVRHHRVLRGGCVCVADHAEQAVALRLAIDDEIGVKNFVATVLTVGLREHHQLGVSRIALELLK